MIKKQGADEREFRFHLGAAWDTVHSIWRNVRSYIWDVALPRDRARVYLDTNQVDVATGTWTTVQINHNSFTPRGIAVDTSYWKMTIAKAGWYILSGQVNFLSATVVADKRVSAGIYNGSTILSQGVLHTAVAAKSIHVPATPTLEYLSVGDVLYLKVWHEFGSNANVGAGRELTFLCAHLISE